MQWCEAESLESHPGFHKELRTAASSTPLEPSVHALQVPHFEGPLGEVRKNSQGRPLPGSQCNKGWGGNKLAGALISLSGPQARERVVLAQRVCVRSKEGHTERPAGSPPAQKMWTLPKPFSLANTFKLLDRSHRTHLPTLLPGHDSARCPAPRSFSGCSVPSSGGQGPRLWPKEPTPGDHVAAVQPQDREPENKALKP